MISENLREIRERMSRAALRAGRDPQGVRLIAVAKAQSIEKIQEAIAAGQKDLGENYAQELLAHSSQLTAIGDSDESRPSQLAVSRELSAIQWHFIGHLQRNKVKQIIDKVTIIHSVDSKELAQEINKRAQQIGKIQAILLEINVGGEGSKTGLATDDVENLVREMAGYENVDLVGLMCIPPALQNPEAARPHFQTLQKIRGGINEKSLYKHPLTELSMGMTQDFEVAIEEGATLVRVGTGIFGERKN